mmetsp:Transcript_4248/g.7108  ORF Transcript_4248/g.7108 Transcript_4248/m.7108 type:complete len:245 (-) Transcript_4248:7-741(-)
MTLGEWGEPIKQIESPLDDREDTTPDYLDTPLTDSPFDGDNWQDAIVHQNHDTIELAGSNWIATKIRGTHTSPNHEVLLFFASDTRLEGHGGCKGFDASWDMLSGIDFLQQFSVNEFVSTFRFCKGVIGQTEMDFFNGLQQGPVVYDIDVDELTLWDTVIGEGGRQARGNILAKFTNAHVPNWGGHSLVGMAGEEAKAVIETINPSLEVQLVPEGSMMTADYRLNRVRIFVDKNRKVSREPQRG